jgi:hypothetical protein
MRRWFLVGALAAIATGLTAAPVAAKEGVEATLTAPVSLAAAPGDEITVAWKLTYENENGKRRPFNATGVFVELFSAGDGDSTIGSASDTAHSTGEYEALVAVPEGGIGGIQIALRGWADGEPSPLVFPITNNPLPEVSAAPKAAAAPSPTRPAPIPESNAGSRASWIVLGVVVAAFALGGAVIVLRGRHRGAPA